MGFIRKLINIMSVIVAMVTDACSQSCSRVETFNVGLTSAVVNAQSRLPRILSALKSSNADLICLQEVWMEEDVAYLTEGLQSTFPHHYSAIHYTKDVLKEPQRRGLFHLFKPKDTACNALETSYVYSRVLMVCGLFNGCLSKSGWALGKCITDECDTVLRKPFIRASCISCIFLNALNSVQDAIKTCSIPGKHNNRLNGPGLLVLSKRDLGSVGYHSFFPGRRAIIERGHIDVQLPNGINTACTHLSSNVEEYIEYDLSHGSYQSQQAVEIGKLAGRGDGAVVIGDLNTGPSNHGNVDDEDSNLEGEFVDNYNAMVSMGFRSPYVDTIGRCTYCTTNYLTEGYPNQILDHIMIRGDSITAWDVQRVYDVGAPHLSDHYGIAMKLCRE